MMQTLKANISSYFLHHPKERKEKRKSVKRKKKRKKNSQKRNTPRSHTEHLPDPSTGV